MGGFGSGRYGGRPTADACQRIDLAWMLRTGRAKEGTYLQGVLSWSCRGEHSGSIGYKAIMDDPGHERLELDYVRGPEGERETVHQTVRLTFTQPHYGGKRWWMICPYRGVPVGKLYKPLSGDRFASRHAWRLGYHCQRIAPRDRTSEALFRLQEKLGCDRGVGNWPGRPKGMWRRTFERHMAQYEELDAAVAVELMAMVSRLKGRLEL